MGLSTIAQTHGRAVAIAGAAAGTVFGIGALLLVAMHAASSRAQPISASKQATSDPSEISSPRSTSDRATTIAGVDAGALTPIETNSDIPILPASALPRVNDVGNSPPPVVPAPARNANRGAPAKSAPPTPAPMKRRVDDGF
jgi:hypothetical protein